MEDEIFLSIGKNKVSDPSSYSENNSFSIISFVNLSVSESGVNER